MYSAEGCTKGGGRDGGEIGGGGGGGGDAKFSPVTVYARSLERWCLAHTVPQVSAPSFFPGQSIACMGPSRSDRSSVLAFAMRLCITPKVPNLVSMVLSTRKSGKKMFQSASNATGGGGL